ncbi:hypothetical protein [Paenibacillus sp. MMS20-IR301]|uniref:coiled-coil domain-containing protein n=1 Tax=Paenibacillus sp. MMS20-IR301 TaxID=2895946 RepID=UPI0028E2A2B0|nr:hypothetical protein [Paenibacillus sp. MMS20-IR301]WNS43809.1 hypothetical protein LOS79_00640 [Paenibacillus sp. MMS20-IR301]
MYLSAAGPDTGASTAAPSIPDNEETRRLLEQTLSSAEIEREIVRITAEQQTLARKAAGLKEQAAAQQTAIADKQERAGAVVRAYYMGERDGLLTAFLSAKSISRMLALFDYYEIIMGRDKETLSAYEAQYKELKATLTAAERSSAELAELKTALEEQQKRVLALNEQIEGGIRASTDPERMGLLLEEFSKYWENIGIHEVRTYFKALSSAMKHLPQFVQNRDGVLVRKGMTYNLALSQEDLNEFLVSQNKLFKDFGFAFKDNEITASGKSGGLSLSLTGHYTIQDEPVNGLIFHVDSIVFNGLQLPDTTRQELEEEFDLGFYPAKIVSFLRATEVSSMDGVLHVKLSLSF